MLFVEMIGEGKCHGRAGNGAVAVAVAVAVRNGGDAVMRHQTDGPRTGADTAFGRSIMDGGDGI
jgi:hypothetical protein